MAPKPSEFLIVMCQQILVRLTSTEFHENSFSGSQIVTCGWMDGWGDMVRLAGAWLQILTVNIRFINLTVNIMLYWNQLISPIPHPPAQIALEADMLQNQLTIAI
jgi:hypothetical protein